MKDIKLIFLQSALCKWKISTIKKFSLQFYQKIFLKMIIVFLVHFDRKQYLTNSILFKISVIKNTILFIT